MAETRENIGGKGHFILTLDNGDKLAYIETPTAVYRVDSETEDAAVFPDGVTFEDGTVKGRGKASNANQDPLSKKFN